MTSTSTKGQRILVVDDDSTVCDSIQMLLSFDGHAVRTARNAKEALDLFDPAGCDLVITDYAMPGMPGTELAKIIHRRAPSLPIIMVTAYAEMLGAWKADISHVSCVVSKPFRLEDLRRALATVLKP